MSAHKQFLILVLAILMMMVIAACGGDDEDEAAEFECEDEIGCVTIAPDDPIKIASVQVLSGNPAPLGTTQDETVRFTVSEQDDTLLGHPIEVISEDDLCTYEGGANAALKIVADPQILGVVGSTCSGAASGTVPIVSEGGLVMISGLNTAPSLTTVDGEEPGEDWNPGYFRVITNGVAQAAAASRFAFEELGYTRAATINDGDTFSVGLTRAFEREFTALGGEVVADLSVNKGDEDMEPTLNAIALAEAEIVFIPIFQPEADFIVNQSVDVEGLEDVVWIGMDSLLLDTFIEAIGENGEGAYFATATLVDTPEIVDLRSRFEEFYGEPPKHGAYVFAYDATSLLLNAIETVAVQEDDGTLHIGRQALRDQLAATSTFDGVSGSLTCDEFGDCSAAVLSVGRVDDAGDGRQGVLDNILVTYTFGD